MKSKELFKKNIIGNPLNCDRVTGQEFNIVNYGYGRISKRGKYKEF